MFLKPLMYSEIFRSWLNRSYCFEKSLYGSYPVHVISSSAVVIGLFLFSFWTNMEEKQQRSSKKNKYMKPINARAVALSPEPVFWLELAWKLLSGRFATVHLIRWLKRPPWPGRFSRGDSAILSWESTEDTLLEHIQYWGHFLENHWPLPGTTVASHRNVCGSGL